MKKIILVVIAATLSFGISSVVYSMDIETTQHYSASVTQNFVEMDKKEHVLCQKDNVSKIQELEFLWTLWGKDTVVSQCECPEASCCTCCIV